VKRRRSGVKRKAWDISRLFSLFVKLLRSVKRIISMNLSDPSSTKPTAQSSAQFTTQPVAPSIENLPNDVDALKALVVELLATLKEERNDKAALRERLDRLLHRLYGPRTERVDPNQLLLFAELAAAATAAEPFPPPPQTEPKPAKRKARPHGRRRLPEHLPREPRHHQLTEAERLCPDCGQVRVDIGADTSEQRVRPPNTMVGLSGGRTGR
jgi:transposase